MTIFKAKQPHRTHNIFLNKIKLFTSMLVVLAKLVHIDGYLVNNDGTMHV